MTKRPPPKQPTDRPSPTFAARCRIAPLQRTLLGFTLGAFVLQPLVAAAQIVSAGGAYGPQVGTAQNGVPVVQITAPTAGGISRNQFKQYDITSKGVVLNNSAVPIVSQQAGAIDQNANVASGPARVILNEVVGNLPSTLAGYTEVAGNKAEVIIANPNGITCSGCGFINTTRGVLTTGTPVFGTDGSLDAFRVTGGTITVEGTGLNASNIDRVDLIARSVQANARLWAKELNVVAGAAQTQYADLSSSAIAGTGPAPTVAIDVAALGGMYANKIRLIGTEAGVGVANAGTIATLAGDLSITSAGQITLSGTTQSTGNLTLNAQQNIALSGPTYAWGNATISSRAGIASTGTLAAAGDLALTADTLDNQGLLAAGMAGDGRFSHGGTLTAHINNAFTSNKQLAAGAKIDVTAGSIDFSDAQTMSNGSIVLSATGGNIKHRGGTLAAAGDVTLNATGTIDNGGGGKLLSGGLLSLSTRGDFTHDTDSTLIGNAGIRIAAGGNLTLNAGLNTPGTLQLSAAGTLTNSADQVGHDLVLSAATLNNQGSFSAYNDLTATVSGQLTNASGKFFYAAHNLNLYANSLYNDEDGVLYAGHDLSIQKNAAGDAASSVTNHLGTLQAANDLTLRAGTLTNEGTNPGIITSSTTRSLPYGVGACSPSALSWGYCYTTGATNAAGETIYYDLGGNRMITPGELQAFFKANPDAPIGDPNLPLNYSKLTEIKTFAQWIFADVTQPGDRRDFWRIDITNSQQSIDPSKPGKSARIVAGNDFVFAGGTANNSAGQIYAAHDVKLNDTAVTNSPLNLATTESITTGRYAHGDTSLTCPEFPPITTETTSSTPVSTATITAGGTLTGNAASGITNANAPAPTTVAPTPQPLATPSSVPPLGAAAAVSLDATSAPNPAYTIERDPKNLDLTRFIPPSPDPTPAPVITPNIDWQGTTKRQDDLALSRNRLLDSNFTHNGLRGFDNTQDSDARYRAYMNAAYATEERFDFENGIALTSEAIAQLTRDVVWQDRAPRDSVEASQTNTVPSSAQTPEIALLRLKPADLSRGGLLRAADPIELMTPDFTPVGRRDATGWSSTGSPVGGAASPRQNDELPSDDAARRLRHGILFGGNGPAPTAPR